MRCFSLKNKAFQACGALVLVATFSVILPSHVFAQAGNAQACAKQIKNSADQAKADYMNDKNGCVLNANCRNPNGNDNVLDPQQYNQPMGGKSTRGTSPTATSGNPGSLDQGMTNGFSDGQGEIFPASGTEAAQDASAVPQTTLQIQQPGNQAAPEKNEGNKVVQPQQPQEGTCPDTAVTQDDYRN